MTTVKSMKLKGFKSFAKNIELEFGTGFNCVIGPNGSGKSNIMDALCFVLGKLSAKSMRAEKSSNLIFNGGKHGSPLKDAEVSIVFNNKDNEFPIDSDEVKVTRIIRRNGTSVYKINDTVMTRQQIIETLSAAHIDPDGHNIILQGDIIRFMEMKPEHRRELIEEIAGISIYEDKKHKALNNLNKVDEQLGEATIILNEREAYLKELRKEKDQAEKYKNVEKEIKSNKATYLHLQIKEKEEKLDGIQGKISKQELEIKKLTEKSDEVRNKISEKKQKLEDINQDIEKKGEKEAIALQKEIEQLKTEIIKNSERATNISNELKKIEERKNQLKTSIQDVEKTSEGLVGSKKTLLQEIEKLKQKEEKQSAQINQLKDRLGIHSGGELDSLDKELDKKTKEYDQLHDRNQKVLQKKFTLDAQINSLNEKINHTEKLEKQNSSTKLRKEFEEVESKLKKVLDEDTFLYSQLKKAKEEYAKVNEELFQTQTRESSIKASVEGDLAIRRVMDMKNANVYGTVSQLGSVDKKFRTALEVAAGPRIKSLVVRDDKVASECIQKLKAAKAGIATFLPMNKIKGRPATSLNGQGVYGSALKLVDFDPKFKEVFSYVFANTIVVENIATARRIGVGKVRMVTLEGDLIELSGAMVGGYRAKRQGVGFKEKSLGTDLKALEKKLAQLAKARDVMEKRKTTNEDQIATLRESKSKIEAALITAERASGGVSLTELKEKKKVLEQDPIYHEFANSGKEVARVKNELLTLKDRREKLKGKSTGKKGSEELEEAEKRRLQTREDIVEKNTQIKNIDAQVTSIYGPEKEKIKQIIKQHEKETVDFKEELNTLNSLLKDQKGLLKQKESEESKFQKAYKDLFGLRNKVNQEIQKLESSVLMEATKEKAINDRINDLAIVRAKVTAEIEALNTEFEEFKGIALKRGKKIEDLRAEVREYEKMLSKMGNVNMRALEVYDSIKKEYDSLVERVEKLREEKEEVIKMIEEIEGSKKSMFMKTFKILNKNFANIFSSLSKKGDAALELEDPDNPLDAGVDIRVRILGNRFLDIKSLSGGEKTMAALAFIFAIQEHQPAAFYLLDEVDAALDKKNSELLSQLIAKYSGTAQYIMISHNDNVISEADYVYGVSMHESGISKVVSLKV